MLEHPDVKIYDFVIVMVSSNTHVDPPSNDCSNVMVSPDVTNNVTVHGNGAPDISLTMEVESVINEE
jgi:hypothetical protein